MKRTLATALAILLAGSPLTPAIAQDTLPDGPGKAQVIQLCSACHEPAKATSVKLAKEGWIETIDRMKAFGATGSDEDFAAVLEYQACNDELCFDSVTIPLKWSLRVDPD